jgi:hypothetical protein
MAITVKAAKVLCAQLEAMGVGSYNPHTGGLGPVAWPDCPAGAQELYRAVKNARHFHGIETLDSASVQRDAAALGVQWCPLCGTTRQTCAAGREEVLRGQ